MKTEKQKQDKLNKISEELAKFCEKCGEPDQFYNDNCMPSKCPIAFAQAAITEGNRKN